jgi:hypothetical protein
MFEFISRKLLLTWVRYNLEWHAFDSVVDNFIRFLPYPEIKFITKIALLKGIVSRDWGRLQMGPFDRSEFRMIPLEVYF